MVPLPSLVMEKMPVLCLEMASSTRMFPAPPKLSARLVLELSLMMALPLATSRVRVPSSDWMREVPLTVMSGVAVVPACAAQTSALVGAGAAQGEGFGHGPPVSVKFHRTGAGDCGGACGSAQRVDVANAQDAIAHGGRSGVGVVAVHYHQAAAVFRKGGASGGVDPAVDDQGASPAKIQGVGGGADGNHVGGEGGPLKRQRVGIYIDTARPGQGEKPRQGVVAVHTAQAPSLLTPVPAKLMASAEETSPERRSAAPARTVVEPAVVPSAPG